MIVGTTMPLVLLCMLTMVIVAHMATVELAVESDVEPVMMCPSLSQLYQYSKFVVGKHIRNGYW